MNWLLLECERARLVCVAPSPSTVRLDLHTNYALNTVLAMNTQVYILHWLPSSHGHCTLHSHGICSMVRGSFSNRRKPSSSNSSYDMYASRFFFVFITLAALCCVPLPLSHTLSMMIMQPSSSPMLVPAVTCLHHYPVSRCMNTLFRMQ